MLQKIANHIHLLIFGYTLWIGWNMYEAHQANLVRYKSEFKKKTAELKKRKKELEVVKKFEGQREEAQAQFAEVEAEFEVIRKKLPSDLDNIGNKSLFIKIADKLNITEPALEDRLKEDNKGFYFLKKYKFKGKGTFLQFLIFLERISESERLFNIHSLKLFTRNDEQRGRFKLIESEIFIEAYRYNEKYKSPEEKAAENANKKQKPKKRRRRRRK